MYKRQIIGTDRADAVRDAKIASIVETLTPAAKNLLPALRAVETAFEEARVQNEVDLTGTSQAAFQLEDEAFLREQFLINLTRFGKDDIPPAVESDIAELERKLNDS